MGLSPEAKVIDMANGDLDLLLAGFCLGRADECLSFTVEIPSLEAIRRDSD
jgi:hypothetical protein